MAEPSVSKNWTELYLPCKDDSFLMEKCLYLERFDIISKKFQIMNTWAFLTSFPFYDSFYIGQTFNSNGRPFSPN